MEHQFQRTELLLGTESIKTLNHARVAVFGVGGVGGFVVEALVRSGIGTIDIIDNDKVCLSNINRQIIATHKTIGMQKVDVMEQRIHEIYPEAVVYKYPCFFLPENAEQFPWKKYDYIVDAIDTVTGKIELVQQAKKANIPIISSMGAGNKLDPTRFQVADIYQTSICPLAKVMRRELKKRGIDKLKVVYSTEEPRKPEKSEEVSNKRSIPGSVAFVPSVVGLIIAGEIIKDIIKETA